MHYYKCITIFTAETYIQHKIEIAALLQANLLKV